MLRVPGEKKRKAAYRPYGKVARRLMIGREEKKGGVPSLWKGGTPPDDIAPACKFMRDLVARFPW